jgi:glycosyltransferase involved in cell wall biosynthesis
MNAMKRSDVQEVPKKGNDIKKILFVAPPFQPFIKKDYEILKRRFRVKCVVYNYDDKKSLLLLVPRIIKGVLWADLTYSWFGSFHAFFAVLFSKILRKKSIVVAGGYDVAKMTEITYGLMNMRLWRLFPMFSFKYCDRILAVSEYARREINENINVDDEKVVVVHHGFDKNKFFPRKAKENLVITVGQVNSQALYVKGLINFAKTSKFLPDTKFYLIGQVEKQSIRRLRRINQHNLLYKGFVPHEELASLMQRAKVYVQISAHESFGCSVAEAMLCECIPVVTACGALPEVVGDTGYYVPYGDVEATAKITTRALRDGEAKGEKARKRIEKEFPIEKREKRLIEVVMRL